MALGLELRVALATTPNTFVYLPALSGGAESELYYSTHALPQMLRNACVWLYARVDLERLV